MHSPRSRNGAYSRAGRRALPPTKQERCHHNDLRTISVRHPRSSAQGGTLLPAKEVLSLLDLNVDVNLALDLVAAIDLAVAGNLNVAAPINGAVSANVLSALELRPRTRHKA